MNKNAAKKIAETITNEQIAEMFKSAKNGIIDWTQVSSVNKGMTKGVAWNILAKNFDVNENYHFLAKTNMVWEFGDFLPIQLRPKKSVSKIQNPPAHPEPDF